MGDSLSRHLGTKTKEDTDTTHEKIQKESRNLSTTIHHLSTTASFEIHRHRYEKIQTKPPDFITSPSTPRTHPRYEFRPSPSRTPKRPEDLSPLCQSLEDTFRRADMALFGRRLTRQQREPLPDDVLHQYLSERKKKLK